jgi:hypothetical protein
MGKIKTSRILMKPGIIVIILFFFSLSGCEDILTGCLGCGKLTPWSCGCNSTCYTDEAACESDSGQDCYKCN